MSISRAALSRFAAAVGVFVLCELIVFSSALRLAPGQVISVTQGDVVTQYIAWRAYGFNQLHSGHLPMWNPYMYSGAPYFAGFQSALLYPLNWVYLVLPIPYAIDAEIMLNLLISAAAMYVWSGYRGLSWGGCVLAGIVVMLGGAHFLHATAGHLSNLACMAWVPLFLCSIDVAMEGRPWLAVLIGSASICLEILGGHPQYVYYTAMLGGVYTLLWCRLDRRTSVALAALLGAGVLGVLLAAAQLLPGVLATQDSVRSSLPGDIAWTFNFSPENFITLLFPHFFGDLLTVPYWGKWLLWEQSIYLGTAAVMLAAYGALCGQWRARRQCVAMILIVMLVAVGRATLLYIMLYLDLPGFASFRGICKVTYLALCFAALLVGAGYDRMVAEPRLARWPMAALALLSVGSALLYIRVGDVGWWYHQLTVWVDPGNLDYLHFPRVDPDFLRQSSQLAAGDLLHVAVLAAVLCALWGCALRWRRLVHIIALAVVLDLLWFGLSYGASFDFAQVARQTMAVDKLLDRVGRDYRVFMPKLVSSVMTAHGENAWGDDPLISRHYAEFLARGQKTTAERLAVGQAVGYPAPQYRMLRVKYFVALGNRPPAKRIEGEPTVRCQLVDRCTVVADDTAALDRLYQPDFEARNEVVLTAPPPFPIEPSGQPQPASEVKVDDITPDECDITTDVTHPMMLVVTDNYAPGWRADALPDSTQQHYDLVRADYTLRGIPLSAGHHHLRLRYRAPGFTAGVLLSLGAGLVWLALAGVVGLGFLKRR